MKKTLFSILLVLSLIASTASAQTITFPNRGGTGTSTPPTYGQVLRGNANGVYDVVATSTLGFPTLSSFSETITGIDYSNTTGVFSLTSGFIIPLIASTTNWNSFFDTPSTVITAGNHIDWSGNTLNVITTGDWTGTFDGLEGSSFRDSKWATSTTDSNSIYFTGTQNVGIGSSSPNVALTVGSAPLFSVDTDTSIIIVGTSAEPAEMIVSGQIAITEGDYIWMNYPTNTVSLDSSGPDSLDILAELGELNLVGNEVTIGILGSVLTIGTGQAQDLQLAFNTNGADGAFEWDRATDSFLYSDDITLSTTEGINFRSSSSRINSTATGLLAITAASSTFSGDLAFQGEIMPDGLVCANGEILKKTAANDWDCAADNNSGGGGSGNVATSTGETAGQLSYWTSTNATPATLGKVATTSLTATSPLSLSQPISVIGGSASALSISTAGDWTGTIDGNNFAGGAIGAGDLLYGASAGSITELAIGTAGFILTNNGTAPAWVATGTIPVAGDVTGTLSATVVGNDSHDHTGATLSGVDVSDDTNLTAGDALTLTGDDIDFDGGVTPSGDLGGSWASPSVTDDSHAHTGTTISSVDISSDTNLASTWPVVLSGDTVTWGGLASSSAIAAPQVLYATGVNTFASAATTSLSGNSQIALSQPVSVIGGSASVASIVADSIGDTQLAFNTGQNLTTASAVTFATVDTGQGANELFDMDQNVLTTSAVTFANASTTLFSTGYASSTVWRGGGLTTDCDNATTAKLLWDSTLGQFSCGTDQNSGGGLTGSTGQMAYFSGTNTAVGTSSLNISTSGKINIGQVGAGGVDGNGTIDFGTHYQNPALILYNGAGASDDFGWGLVAGEMQFYVAATTNRFSFNAGGDLNTSGTNQIFAIEGTGRLALGATGSTATVNVEAPNTRPVTAITQSGVYLENTDSAGFTQKQISTVAAGTVGTAAVFGIGRPIQGGVSWPQYAEFKIGRHELPSTVEPDTRVDLALKSAGDATLSGDVTVMTWQANQNVGIASTTPWARLSLGTGAIVVDEHAPATSTSMTVSWLDGNQQQVRLGTAATTINFSNYIDGMTLRVIACNPGATASTITWDSNVLWSGGTAPTHTTTLNKCDVFSFLATKATSTTATKIFGSFQGNF